MTRLRHETLKGFLDLNIDGVLYKGWSYNVEKSLFLERPDIVTMPKDSTGWRPPTPYYVRSVYQSGPVGNWVNTRFGYYSKSMGNLREYASDRGEFQPLSDFESLRQQAEVGALLKLKDQKVNLAQAFAERSQVARMFADNIRKIAGAYSAVKKGRVKEAARLLDIVPPKKMPRAVANRWLELQYGWKPLLGDIHGTVEKFSESYPWESHRVSVTKTERYDSGTEEYDPLPYNGYYLPYKIQVRKLQKVKVRLDFVPDNLPLLEFASLGLTNPAYLAWELIPFSFVVDWAIPVGDWLSSLDATAGYNFMGGTCTTISEANGLYQSGVDPGYPTRSYFDGSGVRNEKRLNRTVYQTSPIPSLPGLKNPWSAPHAANAVALLVSTTKGAKAPFRR